MRDDKQDERRRQIEKAALELLVEKGYRRTSMLQIAKRASASNQTLYAWYGNKQELFKEIIEANGEAVRSFLQDALLNQDEPLHALKSLGIHLLRFTTDSKAIIMNRAAIIDVAETGLLSTAIDRVGREHIFSLLCDLMDRLSGTGHFELDTDAHDAAGTYVSLLFGETQMRQALGVMAPLTEQEIHNRATRAFELTCRLYCKSPESL